MEKNVKKKAEEAQYHCREIICPWCEHQFMWMDGAQGLTIHYYRSKETGELLESPKCPSCGQELVMLPHERKGVFPDDERVEPAPFRGI